MNVIQNRQTYKQNKKKNTLFDQLDNLFKQWLNTYYTNYQFVFLKNPINKGKQIVDTYNKLNMINDKIYNILNKLYIKFIENELNKFIKKYGNKNIGNIIEIINYKLKQNDLSYKGMINNIKELETKLDTFFDKQYNQCLIYVNILTTNYGNGKYIKTLKQKDLCDFKRYNITLYKLRDFISNFYLKNVVLFYKLLINYHIYKSLLKNIQNNIIDVNVIYKSMPNLKDIILNENIKIKLPLLVKLYVLFSIFNNKKNIHNKGVVGVLINEYSFLF